METIELIGNRKLIIFERRGSGMAGEPFDYLQFFILGKDEELDDSKVDKTLAAFPNENYQGWDKVKALIKDPNDIAQIEEWMKDLGESNHASAISWVI